jgi:CBS domain-containing protein
VGTITLFVFGGIADVPDDPQDPRSEVWIALAGPLATLAIAAACAGIAPFLTGDALPVRAVLAQLADLNITVALLNLVPAYPLDGGRILRAAVWKATGDRFRATLIAASFGVVFGWGLILTGIARVFVRQDGGGLWLMLIGMVLLTLAQAARADVMVRRRLGGRLVASVMTPNPVVTRPEALLADVVDQIMLGKGHSFLPVVTAGGDLVGAVDATAIRLVDRRVWSTTPVRNIMEPLHPDNTVSPDMPCEKVLAQMAKTGRRKLVVACQGRLAGVVTMADLLKYVGLVQLFADPSAHSPAAQKTRRPANGAPQHPPAAWLSR